MILTEFLQKVEEEFIGSEYLRYGQCFMKVLNYENIKLYNLIKCSYLDPFYSEREDISEELHDFLIDFLEEKIVCSAIWYNIPWNKQDGNKFINSLPFNKRSGLMVTGLRHHDCIFIANNIVPNVNKKYKYTQGFLTSKNRFVDRKEAYTIAVQAGQTVYNDKRKELFSEHIY